tara:strand:+ start:2538 stop:3266 length:729 start_codon:yes stop_codon:yes gene_type:complete
MSNSDSEKKEVNKIAYFIPNTFTAINMGCGFFAILFAQKGLFYQASMLLVIASLFDSVDGRVARLTGTESSFGEQFDSICDVISFGVAPAMLIYYKFLIGYGRLGIIVSFLFCLAGCLRLARFNANIDEVDPAYFQGLPIPAGALALVGYTLLTLEFQFPFPQVYFSVPFVLLFSYLMISNIPFYSFKKASFVKKYSKQMLLIVIMIISLIFIYEELMLFTFLMAYVVGCMIHALRLRFVKK